MYKKIEDSLYKIKTERPSCTSYLIVDDNKNILIDPGLYSKYDLLEKELNDIGISSDDIDIVLNTHEHSDHMGANKYFQNKSLIMAHRYAVTKIQNADEELLHCRGNVTDSTGYHVHVWLENNNIIQTDNWTLKIIYTPGHTSGSVCFYEPYKNILFSGDTIFSNGKISDTSDSGNYAEYVNSLNIISTLRIKTILPGHGSRSENIDEDLKEAINIAKRRHEHYMKNY